MHFCTQNQQFYLPANFAYTPCTFKNGRPIQTFNILWQIFQVCLARLLDIMGLQGLNCRPWKVGRRISCALQRFTSQVHLHYNSRDVPYICQWCTTTGCGLLHLLYISSTSISCDNYNNLDAICITSLYSWKLHLLVVHWKNLHLQHDWKDVIWSYMHL